VGGAVDDPVHAVGRQGGQVILLGGPAGGTPAAGCQDDQRLVGEVLQSGKISGMLSVNAGTGAVWYHTWHGTYIATSED